MPTFTIPAHRAAPVKERIAKLIKKASKYGNEAITLEVSDKYSYEYKDANGEMQTFHAVDVTVEGGAPIIEGYTLLARVELIHGTCLIHESPAAANIEVESRFRHHDGNCDHCNKLRNRKDVYVFFDGEKQIAVGRTCLRDYMGIDDPAKIVQSMGFWEAVKSEFDDEDIGAFMGGPSAFRVKDVLEVGAAMIRENGWVSKAMQRETGDLATADAVQSNLNGVKGFKVDVTEADQKAAAETIEFFRNGDFGNNNYMLNVKTLMEVDIVIPEHFGLVVSSLAVVAKEKAKAIELEAAKSSDYIGDVKQRMRDIPVEVVSIKCLGHGMYGPSYLVSMKSEGNTVVWFTGNPSVEEGETVIVDATVKEHKDYNGVKQTVVTRLKVK